MQKKQSPGVATKTPTVHAVVSKKPADGIIPKPTRTEIVEALVLAKRIEHRDRCLAFAKEGDSLKETFNTLLMAEIKEKPGMIMDVVSLSGYSYGNITFSAAIKVTTFSKALQKAYQALAAFEAHRHQNQPRQFDEHGVRAEMRLAISADPARVAALAKSPEIAATLAHIEKHKPKPVLTLMCGERRMA